MRQEASGQEAGGRRRDAGSTPGAIDRRPSINPPKPLSTHHSPITPRVELHIEELILHGFAPGDLHHIAESMQSELSRLLNERGSDWLPPQEVEIPRLDGGAFEIGPQSKPESTGVQVANAIYQSMSR